jgi:hypothetical protein
MSDIVNYTASNFRGNCKVHKNFVPYLDKMNEVLKRFTMLCIVTSSHRTSTKVKGAIVTPAQMSNHLVGFAIDCNLQDIETGEYYNSKKMGDKVGADEEVIREITKTTGLRWGGDFREKDEVHFDYPLNLKFPDTWKAIYSKL